MHSDGLSAHVALLLIFFGELPAVATRISEGGGARPPRSRDWRGVRSAT